MIETQFSASLHGVCAASVEHMNNCPVSHLIMIEVVAISSAITKRPDKVFSSGSHTASTAVCINQTYQLHGQERFASFHQVTTANLACHVRAAAAAGHVNEIVAFNANYPCATASHRHRRCRRVFLCRISRCCAGPDNGTLLGQHRAALHRTRLHNSAGGRTTPSAILRNKMNGLTTG